MRDYRNDGFNDGYGKGTNSSFREYPQTDLDRHSYNDGLEEGRRRRKIADELDNEDY